MKKAIVVVVAAGLLYLFGQYLYRALASEETRIGWLLDDVERGFNTCRAGLTVEGFSEKFREKTARISREELRSVLAYLFMTHRHPETKEFRHKVEMEDVRITFPDVDQGTARVTLRAVFHYRRKKEFEVAWTVEIDADLENGPDGWKIVSSTHQGVDGKRPF